MDRVQDELTIYDRALDDAKVAAIHTAGAAGKCKQTSYPFNGFFSPVNNMPVVNSTNAGPLPWHCPLERDRRVARWRLSQGEWLTARL